MKKVKNEKITIQVKQTELPNKLHLAIQQTYRTTIFRDRKKYTRKIKHKGQTEE